MKGIESRLVLAADQASDYSQGCNAILRTTTDRERNAGEEKCATLTSAADDVRSGRECMRGVGGGDLLVGTDNRARPGVGRDEFNRSAATAAAS